MNAIKLVDLDDDKMKSSDIISTKKIGRPIQTIVEGAAYHSNFAALALANGQSGSGVIYFSDVNRWV